jgi:hypothetical protein
MIFDFKTAGVILALTAPFVLLTIWAVTSAAGREFKTLGQKALWMLTASIPFIGFLLYLIFGMRRGKKPER